MTATTSDHADLVEALRYVNPATCDYAQWVEVGMALHESGQPVEVWDEWSRRDPARYHEGECARKWAGFGQGAGAHVGSGTIVRLAQAGGWQPGGGPDEALDWDDVITATITPAWADELPVEDEGGEWHPARELMGYLRAVFEPEDVIGYVMGAWQPDGPGGRWVPSGKGSYTRTAGEVERELARYAEGAGDADAEEEAIGKALGDWNPEAGAWVRLNPLDGKGVRNLDVAEYRFALVESDVLDVAKQRGMIEAMRLPCAAVVSSGGKSVHAVVRIDAGTDYGLYRRRVERLYAYCRAHGFEPDEQNKNPSRLSRMPGVTRAGRRQRLLATDAGCASWDEWEAWVEDSEDDLPEVEGCEDWDEPIELAPTLIGTDEGQGVLRCGQKLIFVGDSKIGKSYALIDLAMAVCTGGRWLGLACRKGEVLYVNLEIQKGDFKERLHRVWDDRAAHGQGDGQLADVRRGLHVWYMRGRGDMLSALVGPMVKRIRRLPRVSLVIIDPVYKVNGGDDNDAAKVAAFTGAVDRIIEATGAAVVYAHHHPKGTAGQKKGMDRMSGSGVYARDADAVLDLTALDIPEDRRAGLGLADGDGRQLPAYRLTAECRSFAKPRDRDVAFRWPRFYEVDGLSQFKAEGEDPDAKRREGRKAQLRRDHENSARLMREAFDACVAEGLASEDGTVGIGAMASHIGAMPNAETPPSERTFKRWAQADWCPIGSETKVYETERGKRRTRHVFFDRDAREREDFEGEDDGEGGSDGLW